MDYFNSLPLDIIHYELFSHLNITDIVHFLCVNKHFYSFVSRVEYYMFKAIFLEQKALAVPGQRPGTPLKTDSTSLGDIKIILSKPDAAIIARYIYSCVIYRKKDLNLYLKSVFEPTSVLTKVGGKKLIIYPEPEGILENILLTIINDPYLKILLKQLIHNVNYYYILLMILDTIDHKDKYMPLLMIIIQSYYYGSISNIMNNYYNIVKKSTRLKKIKHNINKDHYTCLYNEIKYLLKPFPQDFVKKIITDINI